MVHELALIQDDAGDFPLVLVQLQDRALDLLEQIGFSDFWRESQHLVELPIDLRARNGDVRRVAVQVVLWWEGVDKFSEHRGFAGAGLAGQAEDTAVLLEVRKRCARLLHVEAFEQQSPF